MIDKKAFVADSQAIELLRFPLIVCVVFIHSFGPTLGPAFDATSVDWSALTGSDCYNLIMVLICRVGTHFAVPCFFIISGYLFFLGIEDLDKSAYLKKIKKRWYTLAIPYLLWNLVILLLNVPRDFCRFLLGKIELSEVSCGVSGFGDLLKAFWDCNEWSLQTLDWLGQHTPMTGPINLPLWYLRDLIVVTLLSPVIYWLLRKMGVWFVLILCVCNLSRIWPQISGFGITAFFYFTLGAYLGIRKLSLSSMGRFKWVTYVVTFVLLVVTFYYGGPDAPIGRYLMPFYCFAATISVFCLAMSIQRRGFVIPTVLTKSVFFTYAFHGIFIVGIFAAIPYKLYNGENPFILTIIFLLVPFLKIAVCLIAYKLLERFTPKLLAVLTGNRR